MSEKNVPAVQEENLSEILQIRRDKLASMRELNKDPFQITVFDRDAYAKDIAENFEQYDGKR